MPVKEPDILLMQIYTEPNILLGLIVLPSFPRRIMWQLLTRPTFIHLVFTFIPWPCGNNKRQLSALHSLVAPYCQSNSIQAFLATFKALSNGPVQFSPPVIPSCPFRRYKPGWLTVVLCGGVAGTLQNSRGEHSHRAQNSSSGSECWLWGLNSNPSSTTYCLWDPSYGDLNHSIPQSPHL